MKIIPNSNIPKILKKYVAFNQNAISFWNAKGINIRDKLNINSVSLTWQLTFAVLHKRHPYCFISKFILRIFNKTKYTWENGWSTKHLPEDWSHNFAPPSTAHCHHDQWQQGTSPSLSHANIMPVHDLFVKLRLLVPSSTTEGENLINAENEHFSIQLVIWAPSQMQFQLRI
jgi:hypothetical protein